MTKEINLNEIEEYIKALHCPIRWDIIKIIGNKPKTSDTIYHILKNAEKLEKKEKKSSKKSDSEICNGLCLHAHHKDLKKPTLYYHLRELESAGIIKGSKLVDKNGNILKKKQWELTIKSLIINLIE